MTKTWSMAWLFAGCLALGLGVHSEHAMAKGASVEAATKAQKADAQKKYGEGKQAFDERRFDAALERFRESYDIVASPNSHLMIARALAELGRQGQAYEEYQGVIDEATAANDAEKYGKTLESAQSERNALKAKLAFLNVKLDAAVTVNGRELPAEQWGKPMAVEPGSAEVVFKSKAGVLVQQRIDVPAGRDTTLEVNPPAPSAPPPPLNCPVTSGATPPPAPTGINQRTLALVTGGIGLVGMGAFAAFGLMNNSQWDNLQTRCPSGTCTEAESSDIERGRTYQTLANVGLGVGIVGLGTGLVLWLTSPSNPPSATPSVGRTQKAPQLVVGTSSVALAGRF